MTRTDRVLGRCIPLAGLSLVIGLGALGLEDPAFARPPLSVSIRISRAYPVKFPKPYGHGLSMEYGFSGDLDQAVLRSVTTQYSPDGGATWYTDEQDRLPTYRWDNIHGNAVCGPTQYNLASNERYALRAILKWTYPGQDYLQYSYSNVVEATVADYAELCLEEELALKFVPVLHRHPQDLQPASLPSVDRVVWSARRMKTSNGTQVDDRSITKHSPFHWQYEHHADTWGHGQGGRYFFYWDMADSERYKAETPGERPLYYHVYQQGPYYYVQYWYFMTMNDIRGQMSRNAPWHEGDFEHVAIELENTDGKFVPRRVNFYQHDGGRQFLASECWWGAKYRSATDWPQLGYDEDHTHLHVWIARNSHASYNYEQDLYQVVSVDGDSFRDDVDYTQAYTGVPPAGALYAWDHLVNMGELASSPDLDADGYVDAHGFEWFSHNVHEPAWDDLQWLPFRGRLGAYYCATYYVSGYCAFAPSSPGLSPLDWKGFSDNGGDCGVFGNASTSFFGIAIATKQWVDPDSGNVVCSQP